VHGVWYGGYTSLPAMAATTPDLFSDLNETIANLKILVETAESQLQRLEMQAPQEPQAVTPAVPVTSKKMPHGAIVDTIATQFPTFLASCIKHHELSKRPSPAFNPIIEYPVEKFREHCEPFLPIGTADLEKDCDGTPKWIDRFNNAHMKAAKRRGFISDGKGGWTVPAGYQ
jgi:hypothetical protein